MSVISLEHVVQLDCQDGLKNVLDDTNLPTTVEQSNSMTVVKIPCQSNKLPTFVGILGAIPLNSCFQKVEGHNKGSVDKAHDNTNADKFPERQHLCIIEMLLPPKIPLHQLIGSKKGYP